ncbi:hypothetical protein HanRHA438_Chr01g0006651 [Helianthus annuus]|nr:hypothetical protein HanRHA438_Chr01g0006651 [Helianthus annuus]
MKRKARMRFQTFSYLRGCWELKIAEGNGPYLYSTNNFVGRQFWEFNPNFGTLEEKEEIERLRENFKVSRRDGGFHACGDLLMRRQVKLDNDFLLEVTSVIYRCFFMV